MSDATFPTGHIHKLADGSFESTLQRTYADHDRTEVWAMLTESAKLAQWIAPGSIEPRTGGKAHIDFQDSGIVIDSAVTAFDPPHTLAYSWSSGSQPLRPMRWQLATVDGGTQLTLAIGTPAGEDPAKACAGFEGHMEMLAAALEGVPIKFPFDLFLKARAAYNQQIGKQEPARK
ncbi:MAG TPA: SRPBCC family protein [Rhodanobacteraceae bacterium]